MDFTEPHIVIFYVVKFFLKLNFFFFSLFNLKLKRFNKSPFHDLKGFLRCRWWYTFSICYGSLVFHGDFQDSPTVDWRLKRPGSPPGTQGRNFGLCCLWEGFSRCLIPLASTDWWEVGRLETEWMVWTGNEDRTVFHRKMSYFFCFNIFSVSRKRLSTNYWHSHGLFPFPSGCKHFHRSSRKSSIEVFSL